MAVTVGEVIGLPEVQRGDPEVLSASRWADPIRWLHVGDVADLPSLLQGGELVFTTGVGLGRAPKRFLRGLADAGALGLVVELGTALASIPSSLPAVANELDLALVALHRQIKFVDVTEVVHRRIVAEQYEEVEFDRRVHETFTELSMKRASVTGIVGAASKILDQPVVLEDLNHQAISVSASGREAAALLDDWERRSRQSPTRSGGPEAWAITSVGPRSEEWGRLTVPVSVNHRARALMVLERASAALALNRMIERNFVGLQQQAQSGLIDDVSQGRISDQREVAARAHALGLRKATRYFPIVVRVQRHTSSDDPVATQRRNVALVESVAHTVNASGHTGLFSARRDGEIAAVLALNAARGVEKTLSGLGDRLCGDLRRVDGVMRSVCAVGEPEGEIIDSIRGLGEAAHVAEVAVAMSDTPQPYFRASDVRLRGLISLLRDDPRVQRFAETELKPLLSSGADSPEVDLLREYLNSAGNKAALAQRLHISRPALYKRLSAIERALGVDLGDAESVASLYVALMVIDARKRADPATLTYGSR